MRLSRTNNLYAALLIHTHQYQDLYAALLIRRGTHIFKICMPPC